jgi:hypothetical protein
MKAHEELTVVSASQQESKKAVDSYATILSCLVEFNSIEQQLALQDEDDRQ